MLLLFCFCARENKCYLRFTILFTLAEVGKNNFRSCIFSLNNGWTVYNKLKETAEVTHCNNHPHSTALRPQDAARTFGDKKKKTTPWMTVVGKQWFTEGHWSSHADTHTLWWSTIPIQPRPIAVNCFCEWVIGSDFFFFYHSRILQEERMKEGGRGR